MTNKKTQGKSGKFFLLMISLLKSLVIILFEFDNSPSHSSDPDISVFIH